ncbi:molybdenum cofactor biosynthesis protein MoaE [Pedobacter glucosidilyticus]|uniref:molybdenum cofactor biosynthesis protein MoaE n=1 Tax=Pedobacter glucosidilyticus TaxID=1122941 RepID=UPI0006871D1E|nr:molybdenum cofactor biosynthesis protein MoaE [Pedobacter glucosidilyticus]
MMKSALFPQVAEVDITPLSATDLDLVQLLSLAHDPKAGAVVLFSGEVRDNSTGKTVDYLDYEAHESMASKMICAIVEEAAKRWHLTKALAQHRTGKVMAGESAVVVITCSPHRKEAYAANRYIIDRIKHEAPIWKCEYFTDGTKEWGGNCSCQKITGDANKHVYEFEDKA